MSENEKILKLEAKIEKLKELNDLGELALNYSILADLCKVKASEVLERGIKLEEIKDWKKKAVRYKQLENETLLNLGINKSDKPKKDNLNCSKHKKPIIYTYNNKIYCKDCLDELFEIIKEMKEYYSNKHN